MAQDSKRKRHMRRVKRGATRAAQFAQYQTHEANRRIEVAYTELGALKALLFALLAQAGGTLPVTKGTQEQVMDTFARLRVTSALKEGDETTLLVTLVEDAELEAAPVPALTITQPDAGTETVGYFDTATTNEGAD